jgi:hypothetical protein
MRRLRFRATLRPGAAGAFQKSERKPTEATRPGVVEIEQDDGGYYLFCLDEAGQYLAHTSHQTLEDAKAEAHLKFDVSEADWAAASR